VKKISATKIEAGSTGWIGNRQQADRIYEQDSFGHINRGAETRPSRSREKRSGHKIGRTNQNTRAGRRLKWDAIKLVRRRQHRTTENQFSISGTSTNRIADLVSQKGNMNSIKQGSKTTFLLKSTRLHLIHR
jgi:hypothetical protein